MNSYIIKNLLVDWLTWVNADSGAVTAIASVAAVMVTAIYSYFTITINFDASDVPRQLPLLPRVHGRLEYRGMGL